MVLNISLKAESNNTIKNANIIELLDAYVNHIQNDIDRYKERNGTPEKYNDTQQNFYQDMQLIFGIQPYQ
jgi:hypothetical protein